MPRRPGNVPTTAFLPRQFNFWPKDAVDLGAKKIQEMYEQGYAGAFQDPEGEKQFEEFISSQSFGELNGGKLSDDNGLTGSGEGKLVIPFVFIERLLPGALPGAAQQTGDCVSHGTKNACLTTLCCDVTSGQPDEETGLVEGLPEIDPEGIKQGALSTEAIYWYRGYNGQGWQCEIAAKIACEKSALWPRRKYPDLDVDLTKYSGSLAQKYGKNPPPDKFTEVGKQHLIRTATRVEGFDQIRDFLQNGYGISSCGGEGWSDSRDTNGVSKRSGSWSHAMAYIGADDRDVIKEKYGESLILIMNSWAKWNKGGRKILGTDIEIPEGSFWALASACKNRSTLAFSGANGWPSKELPKIDLVVG